MITSGLLSVAIILSICCCIFLTETPLGGKYLINNLPGSPSILVATSSFLSFKSEDGILVNTVSYLAPT